MSKLKEYIIYFSFLFLLSCRNEKHELKIIENSSDIIIPDNSKIIIYNDTDYEFELVYKIKIDKNEVDNFTNINHFKPLDSTEKINFKITTDKYLIQEIENIFVPKEKIYSKNLRIIKNRKGTLILDYNSSILWGVVEY